MDKWIVGYVRVSTLQQKTDSQVAAIMAEAKKRSLTVVSLEDARQAKDKGDRSSQLILVEEKASGKSADRAGYQWMLSQVKGGWVSEVLAWDISRLGRNLLNTLTFAEECRQRKVKVVGLKDNIELESKEGRLKFNMLAAFYEYQREDIIERARAGIAERIAKGLKHGGTSKGWTSKDVSKKLKEVWRMLDEGKSIRYIRSVTGLNQRTIRKYRDSVDREIVSRREMNTKVYGRSNAKR